MAYTIDLPAAARRHLLAADQLSAGPRQDVAGYLYGIAAECALKVMMKDAGLRSTDSTLRRPDPFFAHFPELRTMLRDSPQLRRSSPLQRYVQNDAFMNQWSTSMRYSHGRDIDKRWVEAWAVQARQAVADIGT
jgi:hypothetical protein